MIIGFDAKRAAQNRTGLGNYSRFVIRLLSQQHPENEYYLYVPKQDKMPYITEIPTLSKVKLHFPLSSLWRRFSSLWRVWGITEDIKNDDVNIFHGLSNELPLNITRAKCKTVVTVHDLIFCIVLNIIILLTDGFTDTSLENHVVRQTRLLLSASLPKRDNTLF